MCVTVDEVLADLEDARALAEARGDMIEELVRLMACWRHDMQLLQSELTNSRNRIRDLEAVSVEVKG